MPDSKISALPSATVPLAGTEVLPIVQSSVTDKVTAADLLRQNGQTVTTSNPVLSLAQTWNAGGVTFTGILFNATDTASASGSLLMDLQAGGSSRFSVTKAGAVTTANAISYISGSYNTQLANGGFFATVPSGAAAYLRLSQTGIVDFTITNVASTGVIAHTGATTHEFRNSTTAQSLRVYNTYTDASNYERGVLDWSTTANALTMGTQKAGTGATRVINFQVGGGQRLQLGAATATLDVGIIFGADNTYDIGASGATRPRNIYAGTQVVLPDGGTTTPGFGFSSETGMGAYRVASNIMGVAINGGGRFSFHADNRFGIRSDGFIGWSSTTTPSAAADVILLRDAANTLALQNATTAQTFRVYNTFTDASNYERLAAEWSGNTAYLRTQSAGTGTLRDLVLGNASATLTIYAGAPASGMIHANRSTGSANAPIFGVTGTLSAASGVQYGAAITPSFSQTSTAGYTALLVNTTETTTGSGAKYLADLQVGSASKWSLSNAGVQTNYGNLIFGTDNTYDIGASGATRPRNIYAGTDIRAGNNVLAGAGWFLGWVGRTLITAPSDGVMTLSNNASTDFTRLQFGGTTSSFPSLARSGTTIQARLADNSSLSNFECAALDATSGTVRAGGSVLAHFATAIPAGGTAGAGLRVSSTANFGVFFGSGAPTLSAAKGSLYLRSDGSGTGDRMYVNTDSSTTWTAVTTAA